MAAKPKKPKLLARLFSYSRDSAPKQSILHGAHHFHMRDFLNAPHATHVNVFNDGGTQQNTRNIERGRLGALPQHPDRSMKKVECLPNSRKREVEDVHKWESSSNDLVLCIHGPAGIGKSTLAGDLSDVFRLENRLGAAIFLGAFPTDTAGTETIIKMVAHEIGSIHPRAIPKIVEAMDQCHGTPLNMHLQKYILDPLRSLNHPQPFIIIIDAMDEWRDHPTFIKALSCLNSESSVVKFIITSRLNPCASSLLGIDRVSIHTHALGPISREMIKAYFATHFEAVQWVDGRKATSEDIQKLSELSGGLPAWASTLVALLSHQFSESPPHEILAEIIASRLPVGGHDGLGELYQNALSRLFPSSHAQMYFRRYFSATMVLQEPLPQSDFSTLAGVPSHLINNIQYTLSALQTRSPPSGLENMVQPAKMLFHSSFLEYLQAKTTDHRFSISAFDSHSAMALTCLGQLASLPSLSPDSYLRDLLCYAVTYWPFHLFKGTPRSSDQWSRTPHCSALQNIATDIQHRWAALFLKVLVSEAGKFTMEEVSLDDGIVPTLMELARRLHHSGGDKWEFRVGCLEVAVRVEAGKAEIWSILGGCYHGRGVMTGSLPVFEEAVEAFRHALRLQPDGHPDREHTLDCLGSALQLSHLQSGNVNLVNEAISLHGEALALRPAPHPHRSHTLHNLAVALFVLYETNGHVGTLNKALSLHREALSLRPAPHPDRPSSLNNLAIALQSRCESNGDVKLLNEAISLHREALSLRPAPHPDRPSSLSNLASAFQSLHETNGDIRPLNEAISLDREALSLLPAAHPARSSSVNNLANTLQFIHKATGDVQALNEAILLHRDALSFCPAPHPDRPSYLNSLATALRSLYETTGDTKMLNKAISLHRETLSLRPASHPHRSMSLNNLANALQSLHRTNGDVKLLAEAISLHRDALSLRPATHPDRSSSLNNLAYALHFLYLHKKDTRILDESISLGREALASSPNAPSFLHAAFLDTVATALLSRFGETRAMAVLNEAISFFYEALTILPPGHIQRSDSLEPLARALQARFDATGNNQDLEDLESLKAELATSWEAKAKLCN